MQINLIGKVKHIWNKVWKRPPKFVSQIIWHAGPGIGDQLTTISDTITRTLSAGQRFSDWDGLIFVMRATNERNESTTFPLSVGVEAFQSDNAQEMGGCAWFQSGPDVKHDDSHRPWLEPEVGPSVLVTQIGCASDTEFKFSFAPKGYGLQRIIGVRRSDNSETTVHRTELMNMFNDTPYEVIHGPRQV